MVKSNTLKIGFVLDDGLDNPDGVQQYILAMGRWLQSQGHDVRYLVGQTERQDIAGVLSMSRNVSWKFNGNRGTMPLPANRAKITKILDEEQFDILHVQVPYSPFMAHRVVQAASAKTAVIGTFHVAPNGRLMIAGTAGLGRLLRRSVKRFDCMLSVSPTAARFAKQTFAVDSCVLPNVIDYPRFSTAAPFVRYKDGVPTILFLGRLVARKGCMVLLQAIALLRSSQPELEFKVLICGRGGLEASLQAYAHEHKLENIITFVGFVSEEDKPRYYASADIAVFPSSGGESFGIVLLEAMASGKAAVLAGDNPGYRSVMEPQPDLLFDPHDPQKLAVLLNEYIANLDQRHAIMQWGKDYTEQFDVDRVGKQLVKIYREALHKRTNP